MNRMLSIEIAKIEHRNICPPDLGPFRLRISKCLGPLSAATSLQRVIINNAGTAVSSSNVESHRVRCSQRIIGSVRGS